MKTVEVVEVVEVAAVKTDAKIGKLSGGIVTLAASQPKVAIPKGTKKASLYMGRELRKSLSVAKGDLAASAVRTLVVRFARYHQGVLTDGEKAKAKDKPAFATSLKAFRA